MLKLKENSYLVQGGWDLRAIPAFRKLYADLETESRDAKLSSVDPWHNCYPLGVAITGDACEDAWYVPWMFAKGFLPAALDKADQWINHNIKYDAHVLANNGVKLPEKLELVCTQAMAHLIDADRSYKGGYSLDALVRAWLPSEYRKTKDTLARYLYGNKDFGKIPTDILAAYANTDVQINRELYRAMWQELPSPLEDLALNEVRLTKVLWRMEQVGLHIDVEEVVKTEELCLNKMVELEDIIQTVNKYPINPRSSKEIYDLICHRWGLPVLKWTNADDEGNETEKSHPSFDKDTLRAYLEHEETKAQHKLMLLHLLKHRHYAQHRGLFYKPWQNLHVEGTLHPAYNQNLKTGRLSCTQPNSQQLDSEAKSHIYPKPGYVFINLDQSQIEYRVIAHFIKNQDIIAAYQEDPDTDFHQWAADLCGISRKHGKTLNFSLAFGQGKKATAKKLAAMFREAGSNLSKQEADEKAQIVYREYHRKMPELKRASSAAKRDADKKGYVLNLAKRRLHLPTKRHNKWFAKSGEQIDKSHLAWNGRIVQSSAADIQKYKMVSIQPLLRELEAELVAVVHDSFLVQVQDASDEVLAQKTNLIRAHLEAPIFGLRVPLRAGGGFSRGSWAKADKAELAR